jgi:hypothetical protein
MASPDYAFEIKTIDAQMVAEEIVCEHLRAMRDGAEIASQRLFS